MRFPGSGLRGILPNQNATEKQFRFSQVALALLAVLALDIWIGTAHPMSKAVTPNLDRSETFSTACVYRDQEKAPDVVLLGSSLMVAPVMQAEAVHLGRPFPRFIHRQSEFLSSALANSLGSNPSVFCFAVAGEAVSDAFLITKHVVAATKKPKVIVYGIAPRDFQDNTCPGVDATESFNVLADLSDVQKVSERNKLSFDRTANIALAKISSLWKYRSDIRLYATLRMKKTMERFLPWVMFEKYDNQGVLAARKKGQYPEEAIGTIQTFPNMPMENSGYTKTIQQYIRRYRPENPAAVDEQFSFLEQLMDTCDREGIKLLVLRRTLSQTILSLLPEGFYPRCFDRPSKICASKNVELVNLGTSYKADESYTDTVHLKPDVSSEFLTTIAKVISSSRVASSLKTGVASRSVATESAKTSY